MKRQKHGATTLAVRHPDAQSHASAPAPHANAVAFGHTQFGCVVGEIYARTNRGVWRPRRAPNHWRSVIELEGGGDFDPFRAVVEKMSDEREADALAEHYDAQTRSR